MTVDEFAETVKKKYPDYQDIPNEELTRKVIAKYPDYASQIEGLKPETQLTQALKSQSLWDKTKNAVGTVWRGLAVPEKLSQEGLNTIASAIPGGEEVGTGPLGTASNAAKATAEALAKVAPGFVSRGSILTAGLAAGAKAVAPIIKGIGRGAARLGESISGLEYKTPGVLTEAAKDASLIFGKGKKAAGPLYQAAREEGAIRPLLLQSTSHKETVDAAKEIFATGKLNPEEALMARKSLDKIRSSLNDEAYGYWRKAFDVIAKTKFSSADTTYARGRMSDALRLPLAQNKLGGTSIAKLGIGSAIGGVLGYTNPSHRTEAGVLPTLAMSPLVQGTVATALGLGAGAASALTNLPPQDIMAIYGSLIALKQVRKDKQEVSQ